MYDSVVSEQAIRTVKEISSSSYTLLHNVPCLICVAVTMTLPACVVIVLARWTQVCHPVLRFFSLRNSYSLNSVQSFQCAPFPMCHCSCGHLIIFIFNLRHHLNPRRTSSKSFSRWGI